MKNIATLLVLIVFVFFSCKNNPRKKPITEDEKNSYLKTGEMIVSQSFGVLSTTLRSAYDSNGISGAIKYCSVKAYPLIDSLSKAHNVKIKRTSLQIRNSENTALANEKLVLEYYEDLFYKKEKLVHKLEVI